MCTCMIHLCMSLCFHMFPCLCAFSYQSAVCLSVYGYLDMSTCSLCFSMCVHITGYAWMNGCACGCVGLCLYRPLCGLWEVSPTIHIRLHPSDHGRGALPTDLDPTPSYLKAPSVGVSLLALPLGTGPGLLPRTGGVGICKHLEGPTWQPLNTKPYQLVGWSGHSPVLGVRTEN